MGGGPAAGFESLSSEGDSGRPSSDVASGSSCSETNGFVRTRRSMAGTTTNNQRERQRERNPVAGICMMTMNPAAESRERKRNWDLGGEIG